MKHLYPSASFNFNYLLNLLEFLPLFLSVVFLRGAVNLSEVSSKGTVNLSVDSLRGDVNLSVDSLRGEVNLSVDSLRGEVNLFVEARSGSPGIVAFQKSSGSLRLSKININVHLAYLENYAVKGLS